MPFSKGDSRINRNGRPKGSLKLVLESREKIAEHLLEDWPRIRSELRKLKGETACRMFLAFYSVITPKPRAANELLESLSEQDLDRIIHKLRQETNQSEIKI